MEKLEYNLNDNVKIKRSNEQGVVVGIVFYSRSDPMYWVEYVASDGRATSNWFYGTELTIV